MELRSGKTVWRLKHGAPTAYAPLRGDTDCEVAIIGGGITGALIAYELTKARVDCLLIDKWEIGGGSTSASTSLLSYELDIPLCDLAQQIGEADAAACYVACRDSIEKIERVVHELDQECEFIRRQSVYLADSERHVPDLAREHTARRRCGLQVELLSQRDVEQIFSFSRPAALLTHDAADIDVVAFMEALLRAAARKGLRVFAHTRMTKHERNGRKFNLFTEAGHRIEARTVVFATGYESEKYLGRKVGTLKSTFAIATEPIADFQGWHERCLIWTSARPYLYLRTTADRRAIIGGEDIDFRDDQLRDALLPEKAAKLERSFRRMFPGIEFKLACSWAGTFGETNDSLARIGQSDRLPGAYFALGYGGNGITYSMIAAEIIRDACLGVENPAARFFRLDR